MKIAQLKPILKDLAQHFHGFRFHRDVMYPIPVNHILRGFCFEPSTFDASGFYLHYIILPLYVPTEHIYFLFSNRLNVPGGHDLWSIDDPNLVAKLIEVISQTGLPLISDASSPETALSIFEAGRQSDPHVLRTLAYTYAMCGRFEESANVLDALIKACESDIPWIREMQGEAEAFRALILASPDKSRSQLAEWEAYTRKHLKISDE